MRLGFGLARQLILILLLDRREDEAWRGVWFGKTTNVRHSGEYIYVSQPK